MADKLDIPCSAKKQHTILPFSTAAQNYTFTIPLHQLIIPLHQLITTWSFETGLVQCIVVVPARTQVPATERDVVRSRGFLLKCMQRRRDPFVTGLIASPRP